MDADRAMPAESDGVISYVMQHKFRAFLLLSVVAHLAVGVGWGVPAYVHEQRRKEQDRMASLEHAELRRRAEATVNAARADAFESARNDVLRQLRRTFDTLVRDLSEPRRETIWNAVLPSLSPPIDALARALGDASATESDLRNLNAALNRQLVDRATEALALAVPQWQQEDYLRRVEFALIPALQTHYLQQIEKQVSPLLRDAGRAFVGKDAQKRIALVTAIDPPLHTLVQTQFTDAFRAHASARLTQKAIAQLKRTLDEKDAQQKRLIDAARLRTTELFEQHFLGATSFGPPATNRLREVTGTALPAPDKDEAAALATAFVTSITPQVSQLLIAIAKDDSADSKLLEKAAPNALTQREEDVQYRLESMSRSAAAGRTVAGLDGLANGDFTQMRESAITRASTINTMQAAIDSGATSLPTTTQPSTAGATTQPSRADPVFEAAAADVWEALRKDFDALVKDRLTPDRAQAVWLRMKIAFAPEVEKFTRDLLDPTRSRADLEQQRAAMSVRFLQLVEQSLDAEVAERMADDLLKQLKGAAGDQIMESYERAIAKNVGEAFGGAVTQGVAERKAAADQALADLKRALDAYASLTHADLAIVTPIRDKFARNRKQPASEDAKQLAPLAEPLASGATAIAKALEGKVFSFPTTRSKFDLVLSESAAAVDQVRAASKAGSGEEMQKLAGGAHATLTRLAKAIKEAQTGMASDAAESGKRFAKAARDLTKSATTQPASLPGATTQLTATITEAVDGEFRKQMTDTGAAKAGENVAKVFGEHLRKSGVSAPQTVAGLKVKAAEVIQSKVADATDGKPSGPDTSGAQATTPGNAAVTGAMKSSTLREAERTSSVPSDKAVADAKKVADAVTRDGVKKTVQSGVPGNETVTSAVRGVAGPDKPTQDFKKALDEQQRIAATGHGGVLSGAGGTTVAHLRGKWLGGEGGGEVASAGEGAEERAGEGSGAGAETDATDHVAGTAGAGTAGAETSGSGSGSGQGPGAGPSGSGKSGSGAVAGLPGGSREGAHRVGTGMGGRHVDEEKYGKVASSMDQRGKVQGEAWERGGAHGDVHRDTEDRPLAAARVVSQLAPPNLDIVGGDPYKPAFETIKFMPVAYLSRPLKIDGDFTDWADVPTFDLLPEPGFGSGADPTPVEQLKIAPAIRARMAWDSTALYFMFDVVDANGKVDQPARFDSFMVGDCIELYVDTMNLKERVRARGAGQQFWVWPFGYAKDDAAPGGESIKDRGTAYMKYLMTPQQMQRATRQTDTGYQIEFRLPVERLRDPQLVAGKILGLNLTIETGAKVHYYWSSSKKVDSFARPNTWGDALLAGSDGKLEMPKKLLSEATEDEASQTLTTFIIGQPLRLRVTDRDMDLNDRARDKVSVTVRNSAGDSEVAILEETGISTGVFEGSVRTMLSIGERIPAALSVAEGETIKVTYVDQARANGARNAELTYRFRSASVVTGK